MKDFTCTAPQINRIHETRNIVLPWCNGSCSDEHWCIQFYPVTTGGPLWRMGLRAELEHWCEQNGVVAVIHPEDIYTFLHKEHAFLAYLAFK